MLYVKNSFIRIAKHPEGLQVDVDFTNMIIWVLVVIIAMLLAYIAYRFRESKLPLVSLSVDDFMQRIKEAEKLMQVVKDQVCWNCGSKEKEVIGNLYEDNQIRFACKCGTETVWKRGKQEWKLTTSTRSFLAKLEEKVTEQKKKV
jgi:hypothetical protein